MSDDFFAMLRRGEWVPGQGTTPAQEVVRDEYYLRYQKYGHNELYRQLHQGVPASLNRQADVWRTVGETLGRVAAVLRQDLVRLAANWTGLGSDEFQARLTLIVNYAQKLADEASGMGVGTATMATSLTETQRRSESDPAEPLWFRGSRAFGVIDNEYGNVATDEERAAAFDRMVTLVAELAAQYGVIDRANWPVTVSEAPVGMPGIVADSGGHAVIAASMPGYTTQAYAFRAGEDAAVFRLTAEADAGLASAPASAPSVVSAGTGVAVTGGPISSAVPLGSVSVAPATVLSGAGAGSGLAGSQRASVGSGVASSAPPAAVSAGSAATGTAGGAVPMMASGGMMGQSLTGSSGSNGADWVSDPSRAWAIGEDGESEPPAHVLDNAS